MLSDTVGEQVTAWRQRRGWNRERLAEECARLGMPELTHAAITNIESGRRKEGKRRRTVSVDELAVLALALDVPPLILLSPYPDAHGVEITPKVATASYFIFTWFPGDELMPNIAETNDETMEEYAERRERLFDAAEPISQIRLHANMMLVRNGYGNQIVDIMNEINQAADPQVRALTEANRDYLLGEIQKLDESIVQIREEMQDNGWAPPVLPPALNYLDEKKSEDCKNSPSNKSSSAYLQTVMAGEDMQASVNREVFGDGTRKGFE